MTRSFLSLALVAAVSSACAAGSITGQVEGKDVPAFQGSAFETFDGATLAIFTSFGDTCGFLTKDLQQRLDALAATEGLAGGAADCIAAQKSNAEKELAIIKSLPEDSYSMVISVNTDDLEAGAELRVDSDIGWFLKHTTEYPTINDAGELERDTQSESLYVASKGSVTITSLTDGEHIAFEGELTVSVLSGLEVVDAGEITFSGAANNCPAWTDLQEEVDAATSAQSGTCF